MSLTAKDVYAIINNKLKNVASGLKSVVANDDGSITLTYDNGTTVTTNPLNGKSAYESAISGGMSSDISEEDFYSALANTTNFATISDVSTKLGNLKTEVEAELPTADGSTVIENDVDGVKTFSVENVNRGYVNVVTKTQTASTNYSNQKIEKGKTYLISVFGDSTTVTLCPANTYSASNTGNTKLWDNKAYGITSFTADKDYNSFRCWQNTSGTNVTIKFDDYKGEFNENGKAIDVDLTLSAKTFAYTGVFTSADNYLSTQMFTKQGLYLVMFDDTLKCDYIAQKYNGNKEVTSTYHPFSVFVDSNKVQIFGFSRKDGGTLTTDSTEVSSIKVMYLADTNALDCDITVAPSDANDFYKHKADIVCDGTNDTYILASLFGCYDSIKVLLYDGTFNIDTMWTYSDTAKISLALNEYNFGSTGGNYRKVIHIGGMNMCCPTVNKSVTFKVAQALHESLSDSGMNYFIIGTPYDYDEDNSEAIDRMACSVELENFNIWGYLYDKPITYVDTTRCLSTTLNSVNIRSWQGVNRNAYTAFADTPNAECCGIRVGRGSDYGIQNHVEHLNVWYCGKGIALNGEHFVFNDCKVHHCYIGIYVGDRKTVGLLEHPNIFLGCSIEACYRFGIFSKFGITTEQDYVKDTTNGIVKSTIVMIGTSTEQTWTTPTNEGSGTSITKPFKEIIKGMWRGRIEIDTNGVDAVESGDFANVTVTAY